MLKTGCFFRFPKLVLTLGEKSRHSFGSDYIMEKGTKSHHLFPYNHIFTSSCSAHLCLVGNCIQWEATHHIAPIREEMSFWQYVSFHLTLGVSYWRSVKQVIKKKKEDQVWTEFSVRNCQARRVQICTSQWWDHNNFSKSSCLCSFKI